MKWLLTPLLTALLGGGTFWFTPKPAPSTPHSLQEQADSVPGSALVWMGLDFTDQLHDQTPAQWLTRQREAHPGFQSMLDKWEQSTGVKADDLAQAVGTGGYLAVLPKGSAPLIGADGGPQLEAVLVLAVGDFARARTLADKLSDAADVQVMLTPGALYLGSSAAAIEEARLAVEQHSHTLGQTMTFREAAVQLPGLAQAGGSATYINAQPMWQALAPQVPAAVAAELSHFPYYAAAVQPKGDDWVAESFLPIRRDPDTALTRALLHPPTGSAPMARLVPPTWGYYATAQMLYSFEALHAMLALISTDDEFLTPVLEKSKAIEARLQAAFTGEAGFALNLASSLQQLEDKLSQIQALNPYDGCRKNCKNVAVALELYSTDFGGRYPSSMGKLVEGQYLKAIPTCPSAGKDTYSGSYQMTTTPDMFSFACAGNNHGKGENIPFYNAEVGLSNQEEAAPKAPVRYEGVLMLPVRDLAKAHELEQQVLGSGMVESQSVTLEGHTAVSATVLGTPCAWTWLQGPDVLVISSGATAQQNLSQVLAVAGQPASASLAGQPGFSALQGLRSGQPALHTYYLDQNLMIASLIKLMEQQPEELGMIATALRAFTTPDPTATTAVVEVEPEGLRLRGTGSGFAVAKAGGLAAALLLPNFVESRSLGQLTACKSNEKNIATALEMYSVDYNGNYPTDLKKLTEGNYLRALPTCPAAGTDTYSSSYQRSSNPDAFSFCCSGHNHPAIPSDYPRYDSMNGLSQQP